jgi:4-hydroxybenzoate polyprenyltransferase
MEPTLSAQQTASIAFRLRGQLLHLSLSVEAAFALLRRSPSNLPRLLGWLFTGPVALRERLSGMGLLDGSQIPLDQECISRMQAERAAGRRVLLVHDGWPDLARAVAARIGCVDEVVSAELAASRGAITAKVVVASAGAGRTILAWVRQMRVYQWLKNALVGVPLLTAHLFLPEPLFRAGVAFVAFGLVASATYIINDLLDLQADRAHPRKSRRPMASGAISGATGLLGSAMLLTAGLLLAWRLSMPLAGVLVLYVMMTLAYSLTFKTYVLIDVMLLAILYTLRILAGALAVNVEFSSWLLAFSIFIFLSLALVKRSSELVLMASMLRERAEGRDYGRNDGPIINAMGVASGYLAVMVLALYVDTDNGRSSYSRPELLWLLCPLVLYWVSRLWLKTSRGEMHDDPLVYSIRDRASWVVFAAMLAVVLLAI